MFEGEIEEICRKLVEEAKRGNIQAIKLVLDRILPTKKEDFDRITFRKEKDKIYRCDIEKGFAPDVSKHVLKQGHKNLTITTNIVDGRTASRTRTIKKHLKRSTQ